MRTLQDVLSNYKETVAIISNKYLDGVLPHRAKIDNTFRILSDEESKYLYGQELLLCILRNFLNGDKASVFSGLMSHKEFTDLMEKAKSLYPEISCPDNAAAINIMNYCKATTFIIEQYRYKDIVKIEKGDVCLDIGACLGDTAIYMNKKWSIASILFRNRSKQHCMHGKNFFETRTQFHKDHTECNLK